MAKKKAAKKTPEATNEFPDSPQGLLDERNELSSKYERVRREVVAMNAECDEQASEIESLKSNIEILKAGGAKESGSDVISMGDMMGQIHNRIGKIHDPARSAEHGQIMRLIESDLSVWITDGRIKCLVDRKTSHSYFTVTDAKEFVDGAVVRRT